MILWETPNIELILSDCKDGMHNTPDNYYDLAIVDPPYGLDNKLVQRGGKHKNSKFAVLYEKGNRWDKIPKQNYFDELFRISKNQIICGANHFVLPPSRGIICWDKEQALPTFSRWEYIWTSFDIVARYYRKSSTDINRFHPTQKPVQLYKWLLKNYAKEGDKIFDSHCGSGSSLIACHEMGFDITAYEIDKDYYEASIKRFNLVTSQLKIKFNE